MYSEKENCNCIDKVKCQVTACVHHTPENYCNADGIRVANESAERQAETFCSTFKAQNGFSS